jgi:hypothetical protein
LFTLKRNSRVQQFPGYDYVRCGLDNVVWEFRRQTATDTSELARAGGRSYVDEHTGPIMLWEEFERYPWPQPNQWNSRSLEWLERNLPNGMCVIGSAGSAHFAEHLSWLMGYETLCLALFDQRDLVAARQRYGDRIALLGGLDMDFFVAATKHKSASASVARWSNVCRVAVTVSAPATAPPTMSRSTITSQCTTRETGSRLKCMSGKSGSTGVSACRAG